MEAFELWLMEAELFQERSDEELRKYFAKLEEQGLVISRKTLDEMRVQLSSISTESISSMADCHTGILAARMGIAVVLLVLATWFVMHV